MIFSGVHESASRRWCSLPLLYFERLDGILGMFDFFSLKVELKAKVELCLFFYTTGGIFIQKFISNKRKQYSEYMSIQTWIIHAK